MPDFYWPEYREKTSACQRQIHKQNQVNITANYWHLWRESLHWDKRNQEVPVCRFMNSSVKNAKSNLKLWHWAWVKNPKPPVRPANPKKHAKWSPGSAKGNTAATSPVPPPRPARRQAPPVLRVLRQTARAAAIKIVFHHPGRVNGPGKNIFLRLPPASRPFLQFSVRGSSPAKHVFWVFSACFFFSGKFRMLSIMTSRK